jgi:hypothetical protein
MARWTVLLLLLTVLCGAGRAGPSPPCEVLHVLPGGPADAAGLARGDVLDTLDGRPVRSTEDLAARLARVAPGQTVRLGYTREGRGGVALLRLEKRYLPVLTPGPVRPLSARPGKPVYQDARPLLVREAGKATLSAPGPARVHVQLDPHCRAEAAIAGPELRAGQVRGNGETAGSRWYRLPRGGEFALGGGARLRTEFNTAAHWFTDPVSYSRPLGVTTSPLTDRLGDPVGVLAIAPGGFGPALLEVRSRWQGWRITCWDPELESAFDGPTPWRPHVVWGFSCKGLPSGAPLPPEAGSVSADAPGARILRIRSGFAAGQAGLAAGDLITAVNDQEVSTAWDLFRVMVRSRLGQEIRVRFTRGEEPKQAVFRLDGDVPEDYSPQPRPSPPPVERLTGPAPEVRVGGPVEVFVALFMVTLSDVQCEAAAALETPLEARPDQPLALRFRLTGPVRLSAEPGLELHTPGDVTATWYPAEEWELPRLLLVVEPPP